MIDGLTIAIIIAVITFILSIVLILLQINKKRPDLIKPSLVQKNPT